MQSLEKIISALVLLLMLLNIFGGIGSGIWLAIIGEWGIIGYGIAYLFLGPSALSLAMSPVLIFAASLAAMGDNPNKRAIYFFTFLGALYTIVVLTVWCIVTFYFFAKQADESSYIPILIWSYGAATGPIVYLAESDNDSSIIATFFAQFAYVVVALLAIFFSLTMFDLTIVFGCFMLIGLIMQFATVILKDKYRGYI